MKALLLFLLISIGIEGYAQSNQTAPKTCYDSLETLFNNKGAYSIDNGVYKTIITLRKDTVCTCIEGRVRIKNLQMELPILIKNKEGKFVPVKDEGLLLNEVYEKSNLSRELSVRNGRSVTYLTNQNSLGDIFFIELVK